MTITLTKVETAYDGTGPITATGHIHVSGLQERGWADSLIGYESSQGTIEAAKGLAWKALERAYQQSKTPTRIAHMAQANVHVAPLSGASGYDSSGAGSQAGHLSGDPIAQQIVEVEPIAEPIAIVEEPAKQRRNRVYRSPETVVVAAEEPAQLPPSRQAYRAGVVFGKHQLRQSN